MFNALQSHPSPYLKDAANQPVNWQPWGQEAFDQARKMDKPVIVSIGYASCHWCGQMSRDNYEDSYVASIMNRHFVCIKVDREERPDLDLLYMEASRMFNQSAGWPLHAFCLPGGEPFWCGTFFPKEDSGQGIAPWPQVLLRIAEHFRNARPELEENGKHALANLVHSNNANLSAPSSWSKKLLSEAGKILLDAHDDQNGGFTPAPKFPSPMKMDFLLALSESVFTRTNKDFSHRLNFCVQKTLGSMAKGGLFDHVNGGFFRYCLDKEWSSPHFEKMLSDNALLLSTYARSWRKFQNPLDREVIEKTLAWIERDLGNSQSGYGCSLSAETNRMEGAYYLWTPEELDKALGKKDADTMKKLWGPFAKVTGDLFLPKMNYQEENSLSKQRTILQKLHSFRSRTNKPKRDDKKSCAQHALLVRAYVDTGVAMGDKALIIRAKEILDWMESAFRLPNGLVASLLYPDHSQSPFGFLEDYTLWIEALLSFGAISEVWQMGKLTHWTEKAEALMHLTVEQFKDSTLPGFFSSAEKMKNSGPIRKKPWYDHAMPSGNSSLLHGFHILGHLGENPAQWQLEYREALAGYPKLLKQSPDGTGHALAAQTEEAVGIVQIKGPLAMIRKIAGSMTHISHRPIFFTEEKEVSVLIKGKNLQLDREEAEEIVRQLTR